MDVDVVFRGGTVIPMTGRADRAASVAAGGGRVVAIGSAEELAPLAQRARAIVDLDGAALLPGLIDTHVHLVRTGLRMLGPELPAVRTVTELMAAVAEAAAKSPPGPLLLFGGGVRGLDRDPTREDLDRVTAARPTLLADPSGHVALANSVALAAIGDADDRGVERGVDGRPTGLLVTWANKRARRHFHSTVTRERLEAGIELAAAAASARGVTTVHAMDGGDYLGDDDVPALLAAQSRIPLHLVIYPQVMDLELVSAWGLPRVGGCILLDGSYAERTAALREPYSGDGGLRGVLFHEDREIERFVAAADARGLQVTVHAQGDAAIEQILRAYEAALGSKPARDHRHRIEHCGLPTSDQLERVARLGLGLGMQPVFAGASPQLALLLGTERMRRRHRYRDIARLGIVVGGGSDADSSPIDPLAGIAALALLDGDQRLDVYDALGLFTTNGAYLAFEERDRGAIRPGSAADFVVFDKDPLAIDAPRIRDLRVLATWAGGKPVYQAPTTVAPETPVARAREEVTRQH